MGLGAAGAVAAATAAASIGGAVISSEGAQSAAKTQAGAENNATALQEQIFEREQGNFAPYLKAGGNALSQLSNIYSGKADTNSLMTMLQNYPGYQFAQQQGNLGLDRSQAARGLLNSGATTKDALAYNNGLASQQWTNYLSGLSSLAGLGQASAAGAASTGTQASQGIANTTVGAGTAAAAGTVGSANAISS